MERPFGNRAIGAVMALAIVAGSGLPAIAQPQEDARDLYRQGATAFEAGHYDVAAQLFERSYALSKKVDLLWNLAFAYRRQFDIDHNVVHLRRARTVYENYAGLTTDPAVQQEAQRTIQLLDEQIRALEAPSPLPPPSPPRSEEAPKLLPSLVAEKPAPTAPRPIYRRAWFWGIVGGVAAAAVVATAVGVAVGSPRDAVAPDTTWGVVSVFR